MDRMRHTLWLPLFLVALLVGAVPTAQAQGDASASAGKQAASSQQVPYDQLANLLQNDKTRNQMIHELRRLGAQQKQKARQQSGKQQKKAQHKAPAQAASAAARTAPGATNAPSGGRRARISLPRRVAAATQAFVEHLGGEVSSLLQRIKGLHQSSAPGPKIQFGKLEHAALDLFLVIVATLAVFLALRAAAKWMFLKVAQWAADQRRSHPLVRRFSSVILSLLLDVSLILAATAGGYGLALYAFGTSGQLDTRQSLFLNAFVLVEVCKALVRMVFAPRNPELRLFRMQEEIARYWARWLNVLIGVVGYTTLVAVPIINFNISPMLGSVVGLVVMLGAYVYAVAVIVKNRKLLRERLEAKAGSASMAITGVLMRILGRTWHYLAIAYFTGLLILSQTQPERALPYMMQATLETLLAVGVGLFIASMLSRLIGRGIRLNDTYRRRIPTLERRLNAYIPNALKTVRLVILLAVGLVVLNAWGFFNLGRWLSSPAGERAIAVMVHVAIILVLAALTWITLASIIEHRLSPETGRGEPSAREKTLLALFRNLVAIVIATLTVMIVLSQVGVNIGPLIAGAGILGLGIGFGSQKLVQDVITGVFIQLENAMNTGDVVTLGSVTGTVERITIRSVSVRDLAGTYHLVPFSSVDTVSNYMRGFAYHVGEYGIAYREDVDEAIAHLHEAFKELREGEHKDDILEDMTVPGVTSLADSAVNIRIMIKTTAGSQWAVGRAFNRLVKKHFDAAGIEIPFPHRTLYLGEDKGGRAPPLNVRLDEQTRRGERPRDEADWPETENDASSRGGQVSRATREQAKKPDEEDVPDEHT